MERSPRISGIECESADGAYGHERALAGDLVPVRWQRVLWRGRIVGMAVVYLVQHGERRSLPGDPGLTAMGRQQATRTGQWLRGRGVHTLCTSPLRRARETAACIASVTGLTAQPDARLAERLNWTAASPWRPSWPCGPAPGTIATSPPPMRSPRGRQEHGCGHSSQACAAHPGRSRRSPTAGSRPTCCVTCWAMMPCPPTCWRRAYQEFRHAGPGQRTSVYSLRSSCTRLV